jgi:uncharacterized SAM-binding protein YcdF (DUF218 family)
MRAVLRRGPVSLVLVGLARSGLLLAVAWLAGFLWFVHGAGQADADPGPADGIVVLTGGADRIGSGVRLLRQGRGHALLISGVGHGAALPELLRGTSIDAAGLAGRITLGREATSTAGNADETAAWVQAHGVHTLIVVTASYHMPRALTELQRSLPGVRLLPAAVLPPAMRDGGSLSTLRLLAAEYTKWLASEMNLTRLASASARAPG